MAMLYPIFEYGFTFLYKGRKFMTIGIDVIRDAIECQTIPFDNEYYWFKVTNNGKSVIMF